MKYLSCKIIFFSFRWNRNVLSIFFSTHISYFRHADQFHFATIWWFFFLWICFSTLRCERKILQIINNFFLCPWNSVPFMDSKESMEMFRPQHQRFVLRDETRGGIRYSNILEWWKSVRFFFDSLSLFMHIEYIFWPCGWKY